jgi:hypothetical protein
MICVGDSLIKNLVINHLIWLLINGSRIILVFDISEITGKQKNIICNYVILLYHVFFGIIFLIQNFYDCFFKGKVKNDRQALKV